MGQEVEPHEIRVARLFFDAFRQEATARGMEEPPSWDSLRGTQQSVYGAAFERLQRDGVIAINRYKVQTGPVTGSMRIRTPEEEHDAAVKERAEDPDSDAAEVRQGDG